MEIKIDGTMNIETLENVLIEITQPTLSMKEVGGAYKYKGCIEVSVTSNEDRDTKGKALIEVTLTTSHLVNETNTKQKMNRYAREMLRRISEARWAQPN